MNAIDTFFLKLILFPSSFYRRMGIDVVKLQTILKLKLLMDDRRPGALTSRRNRNSDKPVKGISWGTVLISFFIGAFYLYSFALGGDPVLQFTFYFSILFFMLSFTLISDFTSVLIDTRDNVIILPKPVNDRTFVAARLLHIAIHLSKIVIPMSLPCIIYIAIRYGALPILWFLTVLIPLVLFSIFFINALYILIIRFVSPQKFQGVINYVQIFFTIILFAGYQILPRAIGASGLNNYRLQEHPFFNFYPPYWSAVGWNALTFSHFSTQAIVLLLLSILVPFLCLWVVIKFLAPHFNSKVALIANNTDVAPTANKNLLHKTSIPLSSRLSPIFCREKKQQTSFELCWKLSGRSKDFRLKVLPIYGYMLVYAVLIFSRSYTKDTLKLQSDFLQNTGMVILVIYTSSLIMLTVVEQMNFSEKFKAAWLWLITPVGAPGEIVLGGLKAMFVKYYLWLIALFIAFGIFKWGLTSLPNALLALLSQYFIALIYVYLSQRRLPFSHFQQMSQKSGSFLKNLLRLLISGIIGVGHFFIASFFTIVLICIILMGISIWLLQDSLKKTSWQQIFYAE